MELSGTMNYNHHFILKTDHMNLTYLDVTPNGRYSDVRPRRAEHQVFLTTIEPKHRIPEAIFKQNATVHNSMVGHWGYKSAKNISMILQSS
jgi:hypothetical protein